MTSVRKSFPIGHVLDDGGVIREQIKVFDAWDGGLVELWLRVEYPTSRCWVAYMVWTETFCMGHHSLESLEEDARDAQMSFYYFDDDGERIDVYVD